jgi:hypothetical protein
MPVLEEDFGTFYADAKRLEGELPKMDAAGIRLNAVPYLSILRSALEAIARLAKESAEEGSRGNVKDALPGIIDGYDRLNAKSGKILTILTESFPDKEDLFREALDLSAKFTAYLQAYGNGNVAINMEGGSRRGRRSRRARKTKRSRRSTKGSKAHCRR